ncbi:Gloeo_Verruco repeat [Chthonomonas calidirosea]|uniref:Gloeo_Verruco repeat n=1 Tax=Chthonomonas calidirosea (strain DSM 23976 / ICMP 18418 / T49) TaxID=1303518 RepID=S0EVE9_CHTCT|nr:choice-of-anchor tandem repeat GloVer-containing protein [Chthonomonas calidirosea]CCW35391.1 Gloeo_Verruco repeat [Chthonomonas calidirosea T49]CEK20414.1 Gloeo_Verruco repeat [Chthonomonas calidirosea]
MDGRPKKGTALLVGDVFVLWSAVAWYLLHREPQSLTFLHVFSSSDSSIINADGAHPETLILGQDGALYGTTYDGGPSGCGVVFRLDPRSGSFCVLHNFDTVENVFVQDDLMQASNGLLYGDRYDIKSQTGILFAMRPDGSDFRILHRFNKTDGSPYTLFEGPDRFLYGATQQTPTRPPALPIVYKIALNGSGYQVLHRFRKDSQLYQASLFTDRNNLYGFYHLSPGLFLNSYSLFVLSFDGKHFRQFTCPFTQDVQDSQPHPSALALPDGSFFCWATDSSKYAALCRFQPAGCALQSRYSIKLLLNYANRFSPPKSSSDSSLVLGSDGAIYGNLDLAHYEPPTRFYEAIFRINTDGTHFQILHLFKSSSSSMPKPLQKLFPFLHLSGSTHQYVESPIVKRLLWGGNNTLYGILIDRAHPNGAIFRLQVPPS